MIQTKLNGWGLNSLLVIKSSLNGCLQQMLRSILYDCNRYTRRKKKTDKCYTKKQQTDTAYNKTKTVNIILFDLSE